MSDFPPALKLRVEQRAAGRCEYCQLAQIGQEARFHIDHVLPRIADGSTSYDNLALACVSCSLRKGARLTAIDPTTGTEVRLFDPRQNTWADHFRWDGATLVALSATGRATCDALSMNRSLIIAIRHEEMLRDRHPPR